MRETPDRRHFERVREAKLERQEFRTSEGFSSLSACGDGEEV